MVSLKFFIFTGDEGKIVEDSEYPNVMFLMHKWFLASEELAEAFVDLYPFLDHTETFLRFSC